MKCQVDDICLISWMQSSWQSQTSHAIVCRLGLNYAFIQFRKSWTCFTSETQRESYGNTWIAFQLLIATPWWSQSHQNYFQNSTDVKKPPLQCYIAWLGFTLNLLLFSLFYSSLSTRGKRLTIVAECFVLIYLSSFSRITTNVLGIITDLLLPYPLSNSRCWISAERYSNPTMLLYRHLIVKIIFYPPQHIVSLVSILKFIRVTDRLILVADFVWGMFGDSQDKNLRVWVDVLFSYQTYCAHIVYTDTFI